MARQRTRAASSSNVVETLEGRQFFSVSHGLNFRVPATNLRHVAMSAKKVTAFTNYQVVGQSGTISSTTLEKVGKHKGKSVSKPVATPMAGYSSPVGKTPQQVRQAYGVDSISFNGIVGDGAGQTIAIIDAYDNPSFVSSTDANFAISDLHRFDQQFGIEDPPSFKKVSQTGSETALPAYNAGWAGEIALDVEWAHAMAPKASILLVEASSASLSNLIAAINYAKKQAGVSVISMSYGMSEFAGQSAYNSAYATPSGHTGVTFLASTGDSGSPGSTPAYSPNVVAVGGTSLYLDGAGNYSTEAGWGGTGGGISQYEYKPAYQNLVTTPSLTKRTTPDVSALADPNTGVAILDTSAGGIGSAGGWMQIGGTSLSSPLWAGMIAVANQGRNLLGLSNLDGSTQTLPRLYSLSTDDFHDVTTGSNGGFSAGIGYDLVTGRGTPIANRLIPDLAGGSIISGSVYRDVDADGVRDNDETAYDGISVYLDLNDNGVKDTSEPQAATDASGVYTFSDLVGGRSYTVREAAAPAGTSASTANFSALTTAYGQTSSYNFGHFDSLPTSFSGSAMTLRLDATGTKLEVYSAASAIGLPATSLARNLLPTLTLTGTAGNDLFTLDLTNGDPLAGMNFSYNGLGGTDILNVVGTVAADHVSFSDTAISAGSSALSLSGVELAQFDGLAGYDVVAINGSSLPVLLAASQQLQSLALGAGAKASLAAGNKVLYIRALSLGSGASLDLTDGTLIDDDSAGAVGSIRSSLASAYENGAWTGAGIGTSMTGSGESLGYATAGDLGVSTFAGQSVSSGAVIVKYTFAGDANLSGKVDFDDYSLTDYGRRRNKSSWLYGDFNYDQVISDADYDVLNQGYVASAAPLAIVA